MRPHSCVRAPLTGAMHVAHLLYTCYAWLTGAMHIAHMLCIAQRARNCPGRALFTGHPSYRPLLCHPPPILCPLACVPCLAVVGRRDVSGNRRGSGGDTFTVGLRFSAQGTRLRSRLEDQGDGLYTVSFKPLVSRTACIALREPSIGTREPRAAARGPSMCPPCWKGPSVQSQCNLGTAHTSTTDP